MTFLTNTAAGGTIGAAATISNTGGASGDAFNNADVDSAVWEFSGTASHGTVGYRCQGVSGFGSFFSWNSASFTPSLMMAQRFYVRIPSAPTAATMIMQLRNSAGQACALNITTGRMLQMTNGLGAGIWTATTAMAVDTWYRVELAVQAGTTTSNGTVNLSFYTLDSTTEIQNFTASNANLGTTNLSDVRWGKVSSTGTWEIFFDSLKIDSSSTTFLGPHVTSVASVRPGAVVSNPGVWTNIGGAASLNAALADESNTTYIASPANPSAAAITFSMDGTLNTGPVTVKIKADIDASVAATVDVSLMQGTTVIATRTYSVTTSIQDFQFTTTTAETSAITNRSDLRIRLIANQT
jgi:hypothetical protein